MNVVFILFCCFVALVIGMLFGSLAEFNDWLRYLHKNGHLEYYLDENNKRRWRLKPTESPWSHHQPNKTTTE